MSSLTPGSVLLAVAVSCVSVVGQTAEIAPLVEVVIDFEAADGTPLHAKLSVPRERDGAVPVVFYLPGAGPRTYDNPYPYAVCDPVDRFVSAVMRRRRCVPGRAKGHPLTVLVHGTKKLEPQKALDTVMDGWDSAWLEDIHPATEMFRLQSYWLDEPVTFLGRFEHLQEDFAALCDILGTNAKLEHLNASLRDGVMVTSRVEQFVHEFYAADFDLYSNMTGT